jgi:AraC-like DNA-binding protein
MDTSSECIPLGHIQTYFDLRRTLKLDATWLMDRAKLSVQKPDETLEAILGIDEQRFFKNASIELRPGEEGGFINTKQCVALVDQAVKQLDMPYLGLVMGNLMTATSHGMAGLAAVTQPTLWDCGLAVTRYCQELFPPLEMSVRLEGPIGMFVIEENISLAPYTHFFMELNVVSFYNIFCDLVGADDEPHLVEFGYPEPAWGNIYRCYFRCPVVFDCPETRIVGKSSLKDKELPLANRLMAITAEKTLFENIPTKAIRLLPLRLRRLLVRYYGAFPSLEKAASELGMSGRTMRRKLAEDGTSYQSELDRVREKFSREYFARGGNSITELALLLGFADSSAFAKAFRRWTGMAPTEYLERRSHHN